MSILEHAIGLSYLTMVLYYNTHHDKTFLANVNNSGW